MYKKIYPYPQILITSFCVRELDIELTNVLSSAIVLKNIFTNCLLNFCHIFSAGFNSGLYGGSEMSSIFLGMLSDLAL